MGSAAMTGCKKSWLDVNENPNEVISSTPEYIFTNALARITTAGGNLNPNEIGSYYAGHWTQSSSYIYSATTFSYQFTNVDFNWWDGWYDVLADFRFAEIGSRDSSYYNAFVGPSMVMQAFLYQELVDVYGNVPYSDALKGIGSLAPKFDKQQDIYKDLVKKLDTAITFIKANSFPGNTGATDILFKGNTTRWIQFANSLKLRILIRQSRVTGADAYIISEINKAAAVTEGFLPSTVDAGINPGFLATTGKTNPIYDRWGYNANGATQSLGRYPRVTKFLIDSYIALGDTVRMKRQFYAYGGENTAVPGTSVRAEINSNYRGVPFGAPSGYTAGNVSPIGPSQIVKGVYDKPYYIMTGAEVYLLLAEAKQRYGAAVTLASTPKEYFDLGVRASFRLTGASDAAALTMLSSGKDLADFNASPDKLKAIWMQKWLALVNFGGLEAWSEYRRTGFPAIPQSAQVADPNKRPVRLFYPQTEAGSNEANVAAEGSIDVFTGRLFWDVD